MPDGLVLYLGLLTTLVLGNYSFTWLVFRYLHTLLTNHYRHELDALAARVDKLERR